MPKIARGSLDGLDGMKKFGAAELYKMANGIEAQIRDPKNSDDPKWLQRWADKIRRLAEKKEKVVRTKVRAK
jgi:hypothetical protein